MSDALVGVRGAKSAAKVSMRAEVAKLVIAGPPEQLELVRQAADDLAAVSRLTGELAYTTDTSAAELSARAELA
jgi:valyl-tRNA synthetase